MRIRGAVARMLPKIVWRRVVEAERQKRRDENLQRCFCAILRLQAQYNVAMKKWIESGNETYRTQARQLLERIHLRLSALARNARHAERLEVFLRKYRIPGFSAKRLHTIVSARRR